MLPQETAPDVAVVHDDWSRLAAVRLLPAVDRDRMHAHRIGRVRAALAEVDADMAILVTPTSLRYALDYRSYALYQHHIPTAYAFVGREGPVVLHGAVGADGRADEVRPGHPLAFFDGGHDLSRHAAAVARDVRGHLRAIGSSPTACVAVEQTNPSLTQALEAAGVRVVDGTRVAESARIVKSADEIACIRWSVAVAEHALEAIGRALRPGVTELQLFALLGYTTLANDGDWHDGRMLCSGPRTNPWLQEASDRVVRSGDLVGVDTDMVGPGGYFADVSRTMVCGWDPSPRQRQLYALARAEVEHNIALLQPGVTFSELQQRAFDVPPAYRDQAYVCVMHGVGMRDEYPRINPRFRGPTPYDGAIEPGMVMCVESYMGAVGERDGVKLEQQVLITETGTELLSSPLGGLCQYQP